MNFAKHFGAVILTIASCYGQQNPAEGKPVSVPATRPQPCTGIPVIRAAWRELSPEQRFPCDADHLVVIQDFAGFLKAHPDLAAHADLREKARHAFAFSISAAWPIYINLDSHQPFVDAYTHSSPWIAFAVAGVLVHEKVHVMGNPNESPALLAEFEVDKRFQNEGKLPAAFDLHVLERQYREALDYEQKSTAAKPTGK